MDGKGELKTRREEESKRNQRHITILRIILSKNRKVSRTIAVATQTATIAMKELQCSPTLVDLPEFIYQERPTQSSFFLQNLLTQKRWTSFIHIYI